MGSLTAFTWCLKVRACAHRALRPAPQPHPRRPDAAVRKRRVKAGGNKKVNYVEGWVEFLNKKVAKRVALMLNNTPVGACMWPHVRGPAVAAPLTGACPGGKKHGFYHDDLWNVKYLPKVKWDHLTEKISARPAQAWRPPLALLMRVLQRMRSAYES